MVDVVQKHIQCGDALCQSPLYGPPLTIGDDAWQQVEWENFFGPCIMAVHGKGDPLCQKGVIGTLLPLGKLLRADVQDALHQLGIMGARLTIGVAHFIPRMIKLIVLKHVVATHDRYCTGDC